MPQNGLLLQSAAAVPIMQPVLFLSAVTILAVLHTAASHPTRYPRHPKPDCKAAAPILSYHVHVVFGFNQFDAAIAVRNRTIERFK